MRVRKQFNESVTVESLERRQHLSASPALEPPPTDALGGQPAGTVKGLTNPRRVPLPGTVFDATWDGPANSRFDDVLWMEPKHFSNTTGQLDYREYRVRSLARWARDGGANWRWDQTTPKKFVVLDVELIKWHEGYRDQVADIVRWFKNEAPGIAVGLYGFQIDREHRNRDTLYDAAELAKFRREMEHNRPVFRQLDAVVLDVYMMGPDRIDRDLASMRRDAWVYRQVFPDLPVVAWTWGSYHTGWNPVNSPLGQKVAKKYLQTTSGNFDAIVIWGPHDQNVRWKQHLATLPEWKMNVQYRLMGASAMSGAADDDLATLYRVNVWQQILA